MMMVLNVQIKPSTQELLNLTKPYTPRGLTSKPYTFLRLYNDILNTFFYFISTSLTCRIGGLYRIDFTVIVNYVVEDILQNLL